MTLQKNLSSTMKTIYISRKKTLSAFSDELGISRSSLQEILKGSSNPRIDTIEQIANQLDMDPLVLLSTSYSEEESKLLIPLFQFTDAACSLPYSKRAELAAHFHAIIRILMADYSQDDEK